MAHIDPPIEAGGGSFIAWTPICHAWHRGRSSQIYYAAKTPHNEMIYVTAGDVEKSLFKSVSPEWVCTFSTHDADDVVRMGTNESCDLRDPVDQAGRIFLRIMNVGHYNGRWGNPWGFKWWEIHYVGYKIHITRIDLTTKSSSQLPAERWTGAFVDNAWHVMVGQEAPEGS